MKNQLSKLSMILIGFISGVAFLISCGGDRTINDADAGALPDISDQMLCIGNTSLIDENSVSTMSCMKQSTKVKEVFDNLAGIYAEDWILVEMQSNGMFLFYK